MHIKKLSGNKFLITFLSTILCSSSLLINTSINNFSDASEVLIDESNIKFTLSFDDDTFLNITENKDNFYLEKVDSKKNVLWSKEVERKENYSVVHAIPVNKYGFVLINKFTNKLSKDAKYIDNEDVKNNFFDFNLLAFDLNGNFMLEEGTNTLTEEFIEKFVKDVFLIVDKPTSDTISSLSDEELYEKGLELLDVIKKTLLDDDINNLKLIIDNIEDSKLKDELNSLLNDILSNNSEIPIENIDDINVISSDSVITISTNTNNIMFDSLNLNSDTVIDEAITLDVSSSLPYDVNVILEGEITSNTNPDNLNYDIFSVKDSTSGDFITFDERGIATILSNQPSTDLKSHKIDVRLNTSKKSITGVYRAVFKIEVTTK